MSENVGRNAAVRAVFLVTGATYISYALSLLSGAVVARSLGPTVFGQYAFLVWLSGWLVLVVNNGLNVSGIRFVSESLGRGAPDTARAIHGWLLKRERTCLLVALVGLIAISFWKRPTGWDDAHFPFFIAIAVISVASRAAYLFNTSIAKGYGAFHVEAHSTFVVSLLNIVAVGVLFWLDAGLQAYLALFGMASLGLWLYARMALVRANIRPSQDKLDPDKAAEVRKHLMWTVLLISSGTLGSKSLETFMLSAYIGPAAVGFFTIAVALTRGGVDLLTVGLTAVLMPAMGRAYGEGGNPRVEEIFTESLRFFFFFGLLLAGAGAFWSDAAILILYGEEYSPVIPALQVMTIIGGFTLGEATFGAMLSTTGRQSIWARTSVLSLILSIIFSFTLVPRFGLHGAVASYASARMIVYIVLIVSVVVTQKVKLPFGPLLRLLTAAGIALALALPIFLIWRGVPGDLVSGTVYIVVLVVASAVLKAWSRTHVDMIISGAARFPAVLRITQPLLIRWRDRFTV